MRRILLPVLSLLLLITASCSRGGSPSPGTVSDSKSPDVTVPTASAPPSSPAQRSAGAVATSKPVSLEQADQSQAGTEAVERKIIRNADLVMEVDEPSETQ